MKVVLLLLQFASCSDLVW